MAQKFFVTDYSMAELAKLKASTNEVVRTFYEKGVCSGAISKSVDLADRIIELVRRDDFLELMKVFKDYQPFALSHPFMVSVVSVMICKKLDWNNERTLKAVALGGLLHDIGKVKLPDNIKYKNPEDLSAQELELYKQHPSLGMSILSYYPELPASVLQIVYQHHECNGRGYPVGLTDTRIFPLAKLVCLADRYSRYILEKDHLMVDALKPFLSNKSEVIQHDPDLVRALIKSFIREEKAKAR